MTGEAVGLKPDEIKDAIARALSDRDRRQLERDAATVFAPSKQEVGATVEVPGVFTVSPGAAQQVPNLQMLQDEDRDEIVEPVENTHLFIRQFNLDDPKTGWAGKVVYDNQTYKTRIIFPPGTDLDRLRRRDDAVPIVVSGSMLFRLSREGEMIPRILYVMGIDYNDGASR
jgi:hypothetical protein